VAFGNSGLGDESDDESVSFDSDDLDEMEMLKEQIQDEEVCFDLEMYKALAGSKPTPYN